MKKRIKRRNLTNSFKKTKKRIRVFKDVNYNDSNKDIISKIQNNISQLK